MYHSFGGALGISSAMWTFSEIEVRPDLTYEQQPVEILDRRVKTLRKKEVLLVRVSWQRESPGESTWELESDMRVRYPFLFPE